MSRQKHMHRFAKKVDYKRLDAKHQEAFNFQKVSALLADYGYTTLRLSTDWNGADFVAQHFNGVDFLKVQLKGRCAISWKYLRKDVYLCFPSGDGPSRRWYLCPHDDLYREVAKTRALRRRGCSFPRLPSKLAQWLDPFAIPT